MTTEFTARELVYWQEIIRLRKQVYRMRNWVERFYGRDAAADMVEDLK